MPIKVFSVLRAMCSTIQGRSEKEGKKEAPVAPEHSQAVPTLRHHIHARESKKDTG
jgi:hypothetical protein